MQMEWMVLNMHRESLQEDTIKRKLIISPLCAMGPKHADKIFKDMDRDVNNMLDEYSMANEVIPDTMVTKDDAEIDGTTDNIIVTYWDKLGINDDEDRSVLNESRIGEMTRAEWLGMVKEREMFFKQDIPKMAEIIYGEKYENLSPESRKLAYTIYTKYRTIKNIEKNIDKIRDEIFNKEKKSYGEIDSPWRY